MTQPKPKPSIDPELRRRLQAEAKSPYRGLRQFVYVSCAASGAIGGVVFFFKVIAGRLEFRLKKWAQLKWLH